MINFLNLVSGLVVNLFVLLGFAALCTIISGWAKSKHRKVADWLVGFLFGVMSVVVMLVPVHTQSGALVDCRVGVVGAAALLGGPVTALTCLPLPCLYRMQLGGADVSAGVFEVVCACLLGALCNLWVRRERHGLTFQRLLYFSAIVGLGTNVLVSACYGQAAVRGVISEMGLAGFIAVILCAPFSMALLMTMILLEQRHFWVVETWGEAESRMLPAQKMAAVGQVSHKIAHSILNALTIIMAQAEQAKAVARKPGAIEALMNDIIASVTTLGELTGELVAFSVPSAERYRKMDLSRCLKGVERLLSKVIGQEIEVVIDGRRDAGVVNVEPNRNEQIIMHMAINAADAMAGRGRLTISVKPASLTEAERDRLQAGVREKDRHLGDFALLSVQDTGCGMTDEVARRVFEPFFSTKEKRENAGLGLASVYTIVQSHRGFIDIQTQPGVGTTFLVYFPVVS